MINLYYQTMCFLHRTAKKVLKAQREPIGLRFVDISAQDINEDRTVAITGGAHFSTLNSEGRVPLNQVFPVENAVQVGSNLHLRSSYVQTIEPPKPVRAGTFSIELWQSFIDKAEIPEGFRNEGLKFAGYIASGRESWCLPSWVWTNAASVRYYCSVGKIRQAVDLGSRFLAMQDPSGGWIVRSDYTVTEEIPVLAPNDSAYIANNAMLELYRVTHDDNFLAAARKCADWIIATARPDGLVWTGFDAKNEIWLKQHTIVDTGFTAGFFANLYLVTKDERYRTFLAQFVKRFVEVFYNPETRCFATSVDKDGNHLGGRFARGQAWALEGLIPAYKALQEEWIVEIIEANTAAIMAQQLKNGSWPYNFDRRYLGEDCKGVPVLAKALLDWNDVHADQKLTASTKRAMHWCASKTSLTGESAGGIFSFNAEGAVIHNFYTATAFVYSSAYALETWNRLYPNG